MELVVGNKSPPFSITCVVAVPVLPISLDEVSEFFSLLVSELPVSIVKINIGTRIIKKNIIIPPNIISFTFNGIIALIKELTPLPLFSFSIYLPPPIKNGNSQSKAFTLIS